MFCSQCGKELDNSAVFCTFCGARTNNSGASAPASEPASAPASTPVENTEAAVNSAAPDPAITEPIPASEPAAEAQSTPVRQNPPTDFFNDSPAPAPSPVPVQTTVPLTPAPVEKEPKYYTFGHIALCLAAVAVMAIVAGVFAGLYFSVV